MVETMIEAGLRWGELVAQKYLHTLPDTDQRNLDALTRIQSQA